MKGLPVEGEARWFVERLAWPPPFGYQTSVSHTLVSFLKFFLFIFLFTKLMYFCKGRTRILLDFYLLDLANWCFSRWSQGKRRDVPSLCPNLLLGSKSFLLVHFLSFNKDKWRMEKENKRIKINPDQSLVNFWWATTFCSSNENQDSS